MAAACWRCTVGESAWLAYRTTGGRIEDEGLAGKNGAQLGHHLGPCRDEFQLAELAFPLFGNACFENDPIVVDLLIIY